MRAPVTRDDPVQEAARALFITLPEASVRVDEAMQRHVNEIGFDHSASTCGSGCLRIILARLANGPRR